MAYLTDTNYYSRIKRELFAQLLANTTTEREDAEDAAQDEMISYLNSRFDVDAIFLNYPAFDATANYVKGQRMVYTEIVYEAPQDLNPMGFNAANWKLIHKKNGLITRYCVDISLNDLYSRLQPTQIPDFRIKRRDDAIEWLQKVAKGDLDPALPLIPSLDGNPTDESPVKFGGKTKFKTYNSQYF